MWLGSENSNVEDIINILKIYLKIVWSTQKKHMFLWHFIKISILYNHLNLDTLFSSEVYMLKLKKLLIFFLKSELIYTYNNTLSNHF